MDTVFIEAGQTKSGPNWGKFMIGRFTEEEWARKSETLVDFGSLGVRNHVLLRACGWREDGKLVVVDLQSGDGEIVGPNGSGKADLSKHQVWVCPMFEPMLEWLYTQDLSNLSKLPKRILLPDAEFQMSGYRREGMEQGGK